MKTAGIVLGFVLVVLLMLGGCAVGFYNAALTRDEAVKNQWAQVDNVLKRRYDLIPNLVETVKGYAKHESELFGHIADARTAYFQAKTPSEQIQASNVLEGPLSRLLLLKETYPELKANEGFLKLQDELAGTENRIAVERMRYNDAVNAQRLFIRRFPTSIAANFAGLTPATYYEVADAEKKTVQVKF